jgi:hypothetical protein
MSQQPCDHILGLIDYDDEGIQLVYETEEFDGIDWEHVIFAFCPKCGAELDV